jgi:hypothetical protein
MSHSCRLVALFAVGLPIALAQPAPVDDAPAVPKQPKRWTFSLLPKSLQRHVSLDFHVITEMTPEGRKQPPPTGGRPVYYVDQPGTFKQLGNNTPAGEHPPAAAQLGAAMRRALADNHYLPAAEGKPPPKLVVVFNYGSFARFSTVADDLAQMVAIEQMNDAALDADPNAVTMDPIIASGDDRETEALLPMVLSSMQNRMDVLQRAELVGGIEFAKKLATALDAEVQFEETYGGLMSPAEDASSPFNRFRHENDNLMDLVEDAFNGCYFVVASAFDYAALAQGKRVLLWRTKMTVNSSGISMTESLAPLIVSAGPYLGRDMTEGVTLTKTLSREGRVEIGTPTVVKDSPLPPSAPKPAAAPTAQPKP